MDRKWRRTLTFIVSFTLGILFSLSALGDATTVGVSDASVTAAATPTTRDFTVTRTGDTGYDTYVDFHTEDGSALAGTDYTTASGSVRIPAGASFGNIPVTVAANLVEGPDKTLQLILDRAIGVGAAPSFSAGTSFGVGQVPLSIAALDVNADGRPDLAVANNSGFNVSVLLNTTPPGAGAATFAPAAHFSVGADPLTITAADVNGDGRPDLAVANYVSSTVSVLINTTAPDAGTASFAAAAHFPTGVSVFPGPRSVTLNDINGDGRPDLAAANSAFNQDVSVRLNTTAPGALTPSFGTSFNFSAGTDPWYAALGDLNGDGRPDLAVANVNGGNVSVRFNTTAPGAATPSFSAAASNFATGPSPAHVAIGDVNGDGRSDLVISNASNNTLSVLLNSTAPGATSPSFAVAATFATNNEGTGTGPNFVRLGDISGDGRLDLVVPNTGTGTVSLLLNTTSPGAVAPSFAAPVNIVPGGFDPFGAALADFNGDGKSDLAVSNQNGANVQVLLSTTALGTAGLSYSAATDFGVSPSPRSVAAGDINGDGRPDVAVANDNVSAIVSVLLNTTNPGAATPSYDVSGFSVAGGPGTNNPQGVALGDVNGDGKPDLVASKGNGNVAVLLNTTATGAAAPTFAAIADFAGGGATSRSVALGDVNGDGRPDIAMANRDSNNLSVLLNSTAPGAATPSFAAAITYASGGGPESIVLGDVNGDGKLDLVAATQVGGVSVLLSNVAPGTNPLTAGSFAAAVNFTAGNTPFYAALGDLNGDGRPDLAVANVNGGNVSVRFNTTAPGAVTPTFGAVTNFATGSGPIFVALGDLDGDGRPDLAVANNNGTTVSLLLNTTAPGAATPTFAAALDLTAGSGPFPIALTDVNGDGRPDLAVANYGSTDVSVLLNTQFVANLGQSSATGTIHFLVPDTTPDDFDFPDLTAVARNETQTSEAIPISGINTAAPIGVSLGSEYSIGCTATFDTADSTIDNGETVCVRHTSSADFSTETETTLTIGGVAGVFSSTTLDEDITPSGFTFIDVTGVERNSSQESNSITVMEINSTAPIAVTGGFYGVNGGLCIETSGTVVNDDVVQVCHVSSADFSTATDTTLTIGADGVLIGVSDTFTSTTVANSAPEITSNGGGATAGVNVAENTTAVTDVDATDVDAGTTLTYSISGGVDAARFAINTSTGVLSFVAAPNFETPTDANGNNVYEVVVQASDSLLSDTQAISVSVLNSNEGPVITSGATPSVAEGTQAVTTVTASDPDAGTTFTFSIAGGADAADFNINPSTGALSFVAAPDFEQPADADSNNVYVVTVQVSDGGLTDAQVLSVTVTNVAEPTVFTPLGNNVVAALQDPATGTDATLTFNSVTGEGYTSVVTDDVGPPVPTGFKLASTPPIFYEITTSASFTPPVEVCIDYTGVNVGNENKLKLFHFEDGQWKNVTTSHDKTDDIICGTVNSLSPFAMFEEDDADTTPDQFTFIDVVNVQPNKTQTSNTVTITGINTPAPISVLGGQYQIVGVTGWITAAGTISNGQQVRVRHVSGRPPMATVNTTLTVGGVSDTFSSRTVPKKPK